MVLSKQTTAFPDMAIPGNTNDRLRYITGITHMYNKWYIVDASDNIRNSHNNQVPKLIQWIVHMCYF